MVKQIGFLLSWQIKLTVVISNNHLCFIITWIFLKSFFALQARKSFLRSSRNRSLSLKLDFAMSYFWEVQCFGFIWSSYLLKRYPRQLKILPPKKLPEKQIHNVKTRVTCHRVTYVGRRADIKLFNLLYG